MHTNNLACRTKIVGLVLPACGPCVIRRGSNRKLAAGDKMDFDFSDDQKQLKEHARRFLEKFSSREVVRAVLEKGQTHDAALWAGLIDLGFTATTIPEEFGGLGLGYLELCVIAEELGRSLAPVPFSSSVYLGAEFLLAA